MRGNWIAGVGMVVAVVATLMAPGTSNWLLIVAGLVLGVVLGVPSAKQVKMTAMPQLVALFNGVGGGTVALVAWVGVPRKPRVSRTVAGYVTVASLFAAIIGSVSFWGSIIAFGKLQEILPGKPISIGRAQQPLQRCTPARLGRVCAWPSVSVSDQSC